MRWLTISEIAFCLLGYTYSAWGEGLSSVTPDTAYPEKIESAENDDTAIPSSSKNYLFNDSQNQGTGGALFMNYTRDFQNQANQIFWGAEFYFLFNNLFRLGAQGGFFKPFQPELPSGWLLGPLLEFVIPAGPLLFDLGSNFSFASYANSYYFAIYPQAGIELRFTKNISFSLKGGYTFFINEQVVKNKTLLTLSKPMAGIFITFGAF